MLVAWLTLVCWCAPVQTCELWHASLSYHTCKLQAAAQPLLIQRQGTLWVVHCHCQPRGQISSACSEPGCPIWQCPNTTFLPACTGCCVLDPVAVQTVLHTWITGRWACSGWAPKSRHLHLPSSLPVMGQGLPTAILQPAQMHTMQLLMAPLRPTQLPMAVLQPLQTQLHRRRSLRPWLKLPSPRQHCSAQCLSKRCAPTPCHCSCVRTERVRCSVKSAHAADLHAGAGVLGTCRHSAGLGRGLPC